jgi:transposase
VLRRSQGGHGGKSRRLTPQQEEQLKERSCQGEFRTIWDAVNWVKQTFGVTYTYWGMRFRI